MTLLPFYEVDVPIRNTGGLRGVHVFTGHAESRSAAVRIAHEVYDQAAAARQAGLEVPGRRPDGRKLVVQCKRYAKHRTVGSPDLQKFNGTVLSEHGADVPLFVASCKFTKQARAFAARHSLVLVDVDLVGFWNSDTPLATLLDLDISRSGTNRKLSPDS